VLGNDPFDQSQPQPDATIRRVVLQSDEGLEHAFPLGLRDSWAIVVHVDRDDSRR
jgi:hypothetical protein